MILKGTHIQQKLPVLNTFKFSSASFRQESALLLQTVNNSWPAGSSVWERICRMLSTQFAHMQQILQELSSSSSSAIPTVYYGTAVAPLSTVSGGMSNPHSSLPSSPLGIGLSNAAINTHTNMTTAGPTDVLLRRLRILYERARIVEGLLFMLSCLVENINDPIFMTPTTSPSASPTIGLSTRVDARFPDSPQIPHHLHHYQQHQLNSARYGQPVPPKSSFRSAKDCLASKHSYHNSRRLHLTWFDDLSLITAAVAQLQSQVHTLTSTWQYSSSQSLSQSQSQSQQLQLRPPSFPAIELRFLELWDAAALAAKHLIGT
jgi:hypothetical protein